MEPFRDFEKIVIDHLTKGVLAAEVIARVKQQSRLVSYEPTGNGYFLTVSHPDLPSERHMCTTPLVTGVAAGKPVTDAGTEAFASLRSSVEFALDADPDSSLVAAAASRAAGLSRAEVVSNVAVLMFGGIETTEGMIANAALHLLAHPEQRALVDRDPGLLAGAVEESLRLEPAAAVIDRYATREVRFGGASIGRGDLVTISIAGANRDPAAFSDPDRFDVRRENARHQIAFAHGPHVCIGMHLARLEAHIAIGRLLARLPRLRLDPDYPCAPRGLVFRKPPTLHVVWG